MVTLTEPGSRLAKLQQALADTDADIDAGRVFDLAPLLTELDDMADALEADALQRQKDQAGRDPGR